MLGDALTLVGHAVNGAWGVFDRLARAIPGWFEILVIMFFVSLVISLIIMPIRGQNALVSGSSDEVSSTPAKTPKIGSSKTKRLNSSKSLKK